MFVTHDSKRSLSELADRVKYHSLNFNKRPFIVACTALLNDGVRKEARDNGFDHSIQSPLQLTEFESLLNHTIEDYTFKFFQEEFPYLNIEMLFDQRMLDQEAQPQLMKVNEEEDLTDEEESRSEEAKEEQKVSNY